MDRRQQKTRKAIFKAFTELLAQKKYDRITVQEIIDRADVGRSTFYAHFETREALLEAMCAELFEHVTHAHGHSEGTHDFSETQDNLDTELTHILYHLRDDRKNMQGLLSGESSELFLGSMKKDVGVIFKRQLKDQLQNRQVPESFLRKCCIGGCKTRCGRLRRPWRDILRRLSNPSWEMTSQKCQNRI